MKSKITHYVLLVFFSGTLSGFAQSNIDELLNRLNENHMGSITEVFTVEELAMLRVHIDAQYDNNEIQNIEGGGKEIFAPENVNINFGHFNSDVPDVFNNLGPSGAADFEGAGAFDPMSGNFMSIDNSGNVYEISQTGGYTFQGIITPPSGESFTGMEFDPETQQFYAISTDGVGVSSLSVVDLDLFTATIIGDTGLILAIALAFDLAGTPYSYDIDTDMMYTINKMTGAATPLGSIGFDASFGQGMFLCPTSGNLYMTAFNNTTFQSEFRMVNTSTGNTTLMGALGSTSPGGTLQFGWSSSTESSLSVEDFTTTNFKVYPNPAKNVLNLSASVQIERIEVYNMLGQKIMTQQLGNTTNTLDISDLKSGTYIVTVTINGKQSSQIFVRE